MEATFFQEPELEFGTGRHIDIRFGLSLHGALDARTELAPSRVRLGLIGDQHCIDQFEKWVDRCRCGVEMKSTPLSTMFPEFPGFGDGKPLCDFVVSGQMTRAIPAREIRELASISSREDLVDKTIERFLADCHDLYQNTPSDVVICLPPPDILKPIDSGAGTQTGPRARRRKRPTEAHKTVWHDLLKARAMGMRGPVQMLRPATYGGKIHRYRQDGTTSKDIEDEASRAWNCFTGLYYKAGGVPWRLPRRASDLSTCYVGVSYFHDTASDSVQTSVAQVFNERGEGVVVRGGQALVQKPDKSVHMDRDTSAELLMNALSLYKREHRNYPARLVCHKSSYFDEGETAGFEDVIERLGIDQLDMLSLRKSSVRFFRNNSNPALRGTSVSLDEKRALLYTQGSVDFYRSYPGLYVPRPIEVRFDRTDSQSDRLLREILALTKMNWNSTRFVNAEPITVAAARSVGDILRYVDSITAIQNRYSYYM
jgi:hypothetical protein